MPFVAILIMLSTAWPDKQLRPDQEVYRNAAVASVRRAFLLMPDVLEFDVRLSGGVLVPDPTDELAARLLAPISVSGSKVTLHAGPFEIKEHYSYLLAVRHDRSGDEFLHLRNWSGEDLWKWETQGTSAIEEAAGESPVQHRIVPASRTNPLAFADRFANCSVTTYRINFVESPDKTAYPKWFWEQIGRSALKTDDDPNIDTWEAKRFSRAADGTSWERTDILVVSRITNLPVAWYSSDIDRASSDDILRIVCKSRQYDWDKAVTLTTAGAPPEPAD